MNHKMVFSTEKKHEYQIKDEEENEVGVFKTFDWCPRNKEIYDVKY